MMGWAGRARAFEQDQRFNSFTMQFGKNSFAVANAFGGAFTSIAQGQIQTAINGNVTSGSFTLLLEMPGLADLTGTNAPNLAIGVVNGSPVLNTNNPTPYSGNSDLDWWYAADPEAVDANGVPKGQIEGSIAAQVLTAAGNLIFPNPLGGNGVFAMSSVAVRATVGSSSAPLESTNGFPPGHLPSEHVDPQVVSFATLSNGQMKGNISAASLAAIPFTLNTSTDQGYTSANSLLDVLVSGATTLSGFVTLVRQTQPDQVDPSMPAAGAGPPYTFMANPTTHVVTSCHDKNGNSVSLSTALNAAAYSSYFTFTADRVIAHNVAGNALTPPRLNIARAGANAAVTVEAQATTSCTVEFKQTLSDAEWTWWKTVTGTGAPVTLVDSNVTSQARFYRARVQ